MTKTEVLKIVRATAPTEYTESVKVSFAGNGSEAWNLSFPRLSDGKADVVRFKPCGCEAADTALLKDVVAEAAHAMIHGGGLL